MNRLLVALAATASTLAIAPAANATILLPGTSAVPFSTIDASTRGTLLDSLQTVERDPDTPTYDAIFRSAVYRNTSNTLDFYYQVSVASILPGDEIFNLTASNFAGFTVDALVDTTDFDGAGIFTAAFNPNLQGAPGSTTTASRSGSGAVVRADFGENGLEAAGQTSATYIFRTNATNFNFGGTFTTQDGSVASRRNFQPTAAVPEPSTWAMMLFGFGAIGFGMRRRGQVQRRVRFAL